LKLFFLSLLWRASVSRHFFFRRVTTGPFERELRRMLLTGDPGAPEEFAVNLGRFDNPTYAGILDPHLDRYEGINYCRLYLGSFVTYMKVDRRPPPAFLVDLAMRDGVPIVVVRRGDHEGSKDAAVMRAIARATWKLEHPESST
jgi:hypothetical protein